VKTLDEILAFAANVDGQGIEDHQNCTYMRSELFALASRLYDLRLGARIVEIGVFGGRSTSLYLQLQTTQAFDIHLIDNWSWNQALAAHQFTNLILDNFNEVPFTLHKMRSDYLGEFYWTLPIDFIHIDGWHDMPGIEPDCRLWLPHVVSGGIAAFHDSDSPAVAECIQKYVNDAGWELIETAHRTTTWRKPCLT